MPEGPGNVSVPLSNVADLMPEGDWFLQQLVGLINSNAGLEITLTLIVSGSVITGTAISGMAYFKAFGKDFGASFNGASKEDRASVQDAYESLGKLYEKPESDDVTVPPPTYIHMMNASVVHGNAFTKLSLWRGRISAVDGFSTGLIIPG